MLKQFQYAYFSAEDPQVREYLEQEGFVKGRDDIRTKEGDLAAAVVDTAGGTKVFIDATNSHASRLTILFDRYISENPNKKPSQKPVDLASPGWGDHPKS